MMFHVHSVVYGIGVLKAAVRFRLQKRGFHDVLTIKGKCA